MMKPIRLGLVMVLGTGGCAMGQADGTPSAAPATKIAATMEGAAKTENAPSMEGAAKTENAATTVATAATESVDESVETILRGLEEVGRNLAGFTAEVTLTETDAMTADSFGRTGTVVYQRPATGGARLAVRFDRKVVGDRSQEHRVDYLLRDGWLWERDWRAKTEVKRQVMRPGEKVDLLKLGEGPFPLPIGQDVAEVHRLFVVTPLPAVDDAPANTDPLRLAPRPGTQFANKFQSIDVLVDRASHMPVRIETLDANGNVVRTTDLRNLKVNPTIDPARFELPPVDETWNRHEEELR